MKNAKGENLLHLVPLTSNLPLHVFNFGMFLTQRDCTVSEDTSLFVFRGRKNIILAWKDMSVIYNTRIFISGTFAFFKGAVCTSSVPLFYLGGR